MVAQIIGNYLVERGIITRGQMLVIHKERQRVRAKLGLIAVAEGYMSSFEVKDIYDEIANDAGEPTDRAFAEIAKARDYLTASQIKMLAIKQSDSYLCLAEALEKLKIMDIERFNEILDDFPLTTNEIQLDDLKSNDVNRIIPLFLSPEAKDYVNAACCAVHFLNQKVDANICPLEAKIVDEVAASHGVIQFAKGEKEYVYALVAENEEVATLATCYMRERYDGINEETLDIVKEIVNKISSAYATDLSQDGVLIDLMPPKSYTEMTKIKSSGILCFTLTVKYETFYLLICMSNVMEIQ